MILEGLLGGRPLDTFLLGSHNFMVTALGSCVKWPQFAAEHAKEPSLGAYAKTRKSIDDTTYATKARFSHSSMLPKQRMPRLQRERENLTNKRFFKAYILILI
jgi:hypothetical protein